MKVGNFVTAVEVIDGIKPQGIGQIIGVSTGGYFTVRWQQECEEGVLWTASGLFHEEVGLHSADYWEGLDGDSCRYWNCNEHELELVAFENV